MFSKSCEYAIKAMIFVAKSSEDNKCIGVTEIAEGIDAPKHFIAKILQILSRKKLIQSIKGPHGGFFMNEENLKNSISDIVLAMDGDKIYTQCALGLKTCSAINPCPVHHEYKEIKKNLIQMIENNTISSFKNNILSGNIFLKVDTEIINNHP